MKKYVYIRKSPFSFLETIDELRFAFAEKWFWVVSNVDIAEKIKKNIDSDFWEYVTLGFCKPAIAYKYLKEDINIGIFMPCSVSVYEKSGEIFIAWGLPEIIIDKVIENKNIEKMHKEISEIMKWVIASLVKYEEK